MADKNNKFPENAPGAFYVDKECINCDACILVAENHFKTNEDASFTYVYKQPETEEEKEACHEALEACPVEAIGNDGLKEKTPETIQNQPENSENTLSSKKIEETTANKEILQNKAENSQVTPLLESREKIKKETKPKSKLFGIFKSSELS